MSAEFKGTKGEWKVETMYNDGEFYKVVSASKSICNITTRNTNEAKYNAKIAAASPELFKSTQDAIALFTELHNNGHIPEAYKKQLGEFFINGGIAVQKATE